MQGARVYLTEAPVGTPDIAALTDAGGRFAISAPARGSHTVRAPPDGVEITLRLGSG